MEEELKKALERWGAETVAAMQAVLLQSRSNATSNLSRSIKYLVGEDFVRFTMLEYGDIQDKGRTPGWYSPIKPLKDWASTKGLPVSAAYTARAAIKRRGLKPKRFFESVIERQLVRLTPILEPALVKFLGDRIELIQNQQ